MNILTKKLTKKEKETYLQALAFVLAGRKKVHPGQQSYLRIQALEADIDEDKLTQIDAPDSPITLIKNLKKIENVSIRRFIMREMIMLLVAAHELQEQDINLIYQIGNAAGVDTDRIDDLFMWAAKGLEWQIEGSKLIEEE